jgi:hypothetical protein
MPALFSDKLAVYKQSQVPGTKRSTSHWMGFLEDDESLAVRWCDDSVTHYGPGAVDDDLDPASYTEACLIQDMAAAALIVRVIKQLAAKDAVAPTPRNSAAGSAIAAIKKCYQSAVMNRKPDWLVWLEGALEEAAARKRSQRRCQKCKVDGCNGKAPPL